VVSADCKQQPCTDLRLRDQQVQPNAWLQRSTVLLLLPAAAVLPALVAKRDRQLSQERSIYTVSDKHGDRQANIEANTMAILT